MQIRHILTQFRNYSGRNQFIYTIDNFTKHNIKYIKKFELSIRNPKDLSFMYPTVYESSIMFDKGNMRVIQQFQNDNLEKLMNDVSDFISREIKI
jgi:hypothetical protein